MEKVNAHLHTPYSFSAFSHVEDALNRAVAEGVKVVGINDFYTTAGYEAWADGCRERHLCPLFNIEFISLNEEDQKAGLRVNDPGNPGRTYLSGKGLAYPFRLAEPYATQLKQVREASNAQVESMCAKLNAFLLEKQAGFQLDFAWIRDTLTKGSIRERHLAKALRMKAYEFCKGDQAAIASLFNRLFDGKDLASSVGKEAVAGSCSPSDLASSVGKEAVAGSCSPSDLASSVGKEAVAGSYSPSDLASSVGKETVAGSCSPSDLASSVGKEAVAGSYLPSDLASSVGKEAVAGSCSPSDLASSVGKEAVAGSCSPSDLASSVEDEAGVENEIRSRLLKAGGAAFVPEEPTAFLPMKAVCDIILAAGGIPTYPFLADNAKGGYTDFEGDLEKVASVLRQRGFYSVEFITTRNEVHLLEKYASYLHDQGFVVTLGSEHNTPAMEPIELFARGKTPLTDRLKQINYEGACVVAAHQHLVKQGLPGYVNAQGVADVAKRDEYIKLGEQVIAAAL